MARVIRTLKRNQRGFGTGDHELGGGASQERAKLGSCSP